MITYNHEKYLEQAAESVVSQRCDYPFELIIGDDGSKDKTWAIAQSLQSKYPSVIRLVRHQPNVGMNENFRLVVKEARGEYLAFCEGDDFWSSSDKLTKQLAAIRRTEDVSMVFSDFGRCLEWQGKWYLAPNTIAPEDRKQVVVPFARMLKRMSIHLSAVLCRSDLVRDYFASEHYRPDRSLGDVPLFLYLATRGQVLYVDGSFSVYRQHMASATNRSRRGRLKIVQDHVDVVREFCEGYISSDADKRKIFRTARARLSAAAYSAGSFPVFLRNMDWHSLKEILRAILMLVPCWHNLRLESERKRQLAATLADATMLDCCAGERIEF
jgi:glycosyltransferase involved in cell wall biosynthesis